ncbi:hypothetical protein EJ06DRAFT_518865 [Trichodelitschia bisporula]|uniref:Uncharacterized protein n=1 Tax=Trichodelitschia bisporula TaxID=703511 RepID=A0A6G1I870_9PEZI|nr:hypothetical protein EJ06DRAFT_518865 [Trichodelitschia bisporula]
MCESCRDRNKDYMRRKREAKYDELPADNDKKREREDEGDNEPPKGVIRHKSVNATSDASLLGSVDTPATMKPPVWTSVNGTLGLGTPTTTARGFGDRSSSISAASVPRFSSHLSDTSEVSASSVDAPTTIKPPVWTSVNGTLSSDLSDTSEVSASPVDAPTTIKPPVWTSVNGTLGSDMCMGEHVADDEEPLNHRQRNTKRAEDTERAEDADDEEDAEEDQCMGDIKDWRFGS